VRTFVVAATKGAELVRAVCARPRGITAERIDAELRNGVLHLRLSRKQGAAATGAIGVR